MSRTVRLTLALCLTALPAAAQEAPPIPGRPEQLTFPPLKFEVPEASAYRHQLKNGVVVYLAPSTELPLVKMNFTFKGGRYLDPAGKEGLYQAMGAMLRRGGTTKMEAKALDERLDFLASNVGTGASDYQLSGSLDTLKSNLDESFALFLDVLRNPRFQEDRLALYKTEVLEGMKQRNDDADGILAREWTALMYGRDHFKSRLTTKASIEALTREDLQAAHRRLVHPGNLIIGVTGDFEPKAMLARLEQALAGWEKGDVPAPPPAEVKEPTPGVYYVEKDVPQGKVNIGMRGIQRDDPDAIPLQVMSLILGSGGFTSRITKRVRSDEGLAYSAGSGIIPGLYFPGEFRAFFQSKSRTVALATKLIFEELARIRDTLVDPKELEVAKSSMIETFPATFGSPATTIGVFIDDELTNRPAGYWKSFRERVAAVTAEDVQRVAKKWLVPEKMAIMIVGKWDEIAPGDLEKRANMAELGGDKAVQLPLRDPLTLEPLPAGK